MIDPNQGASPEALDRLRRESYERTRVQIVQAIEQQLDDYRMTWDDLAGKLQWKTPTSSILWNGIAVKRYVGSREFTLYNLNEIAHVFSAEGYVIFRPRYPWVPKR